MPTVNDGNIADAVTCDVGAIPLPYAFRIRKCCMRKSLEGISKLYFVAINNQQKDVGEWNMAQRYNINKSTNNTGKT